MLSIETRKSQNKWFFFVLLDGRLIELDIKSSHGKNPRQFLELPLCVVVSQFVLSVFL